ncbi:hypothetical protein KSP40_PGU004687 [Platanthera guangdongensis]|uniref:Uncharacterized protein n=1 Tax=Platanthera guangdongensis TaxID=2320717 RepID=A0ABR2LZT8_9ASPA
MADDAQLLRTFGSEITHRNPHYQLHKSTGFHRRAAPSTLSLSLPLALALFLSLYYVSFWGCR